jgi:hypothetical protein
MFSNMSHTFAAEKTRDVARLKNVGVADVGL